MSFTPKGSGVSRYCKFTAENLPKNCRASRSTKYESKAPVPIIMQALRKQQFEVAEETQQSEFGSLSVIRRNQLTPPEYMRGMTGLCLESGVFVVVLGLVLIHFSLQGSRCTPWLSIWTVPQSDSPLFLVSILFTWSLILRDVAVSGFAIRCLNSISALEELLKFAEYADAISMPSLVSQKNSFWISVRESKLPMSKSPKEPKS